MTIIKKVPVRLQSIINYQLVNDAFVFCGSKIYYEISCFGIS